VATSPSSNQASGSKYGDLKRRIIFLLLALVVYRIGAHVPVPGMASSVFLICSLGALYRASQCLR